MRGIFQKLSGWLPAAERKQLLHQKKAVRTSISTGIVSAPGSDEKAAEPSILTLMRPMPGRGDVGFFRRHFTPGIEEHHNRLHHK
jgi:hypothetical protein